MIRRSLALFAALLVLSVSALAQQPKFESKLIGPSTTGQAVDVEADIAGAKQLFLFVSDGGDSFGCDWADWCEPRLIGPKGEMKLTDIKWKSASAGFGNVNLNKNAVGGALKVNDKAVEFGIGTHANSLIEFDLPEGYTKFKARGGLDKGGVDQGCGSTVKFLVFTQKPDAKVLAAVQAGGVGSREAKDAVAGLDIAEGLEATLFASEASNPPMLNPTSIDIDHLGRVWVCEVVNYRHRNGERKEGDRILILEDTNGDGVADKQTVFHQGHDVDSAHGICVLATPSGKGTKVIISANDNVFFLHDEDGDLKSDKKELFFTGIEGTQHDHGIHAFHFGPDGKLYFNFGNSGRRIKDKNGKQIVDMSGREVHDHRKPYQEGMVFRCNMDGSEFETLGWNFRNNWEIAVDSFGTIWQSDNDDDGNKGVRINYVMEFGDYGYKDQVTGAGWQSPRTNMETEIPLRHWHLNDPGVVPNLLQTGAGSPTGIIVYEGDLLPEVFRNQVIHCDAGPNVVRAYPVKTSGAGYTAETVNILTGARDNWFRPSDVCVAPDGSLLVADWYDPGVGGHRMGDADRGRLFRLAPPGVKYIVPKVDVSTVEGAIAALKSPNEATRYLAWTALHEMGDLARPALYQEVVGNQTKPRIQARALWLLSKIPIRGRAYVQGALEAKDPDLVITALRAYRQSPSDPLKDTFNRAFKKATPAVRRELAILLADQRVTSTHPEPRRADLWAQLATQHDGKDRWYLEALGIGAGNDWDACIRAWQEFKPSLSSSDEPWQHAEKRDIVWRSRSKETPGLLVSLLHSRHVTAEDCPRYLRAFDFLSGSEKDDALVLLAFGSFGDEAKTKFINTEAISRLKGFDVSKNAEQKAALNRVLDGLKGQPQFVTLVEKFNVTDRFPELLALAQAKPDDQIGIDAVRVLLAKGATDLLKKALQGPLPISPKVPVKDLPEQFTRDAQATAIALSNAGDAVASGLLLEVVQDDKRPADIRRAAIRGAALTQNGAQSLLKMAQAKSLDETFTPALSSALIATRFPNVREAALKIYPPPAGKDSKPLPPLSELANLKGNVGSGQKLYATTGKCITCHIVNGEGKEVGPNLSEIGAKLSKQALFESIVFPSAGISHNFESWTIALDNGTTATGILVSEDADKLTLKGNDALVRSFDKKSIEERKKDTISLMPADLAKLLSQDEMADVVEYLTTLKKAKK